MAVSDSSGSRIDGILTDIYRLQDATNFPGRLAARYGTELLEVQKSQSPRSNSPWNYAKTQRWLKQPAHVQIEQFQEALGDQNYAAVGSMAEFARDPRVCAFVLSKGPSVVDALSKSDAHTNELAPGSIRQHSARYLWREWTGYLEDRIRG